MRTRALWATTACAFLLTQAGCGEIDNCKEGEPGCVGALPLPDGTCRFDLVVDSSGVCKEHDDGADGDGDGDGGDTDGGDEVPDVDGPPLPNCNCAANQVCQTGGTCLDLCVVPTPVASKDSLPACRPTVESKVTYSFQDAAVAWCKQSCARRAAACGEPCDPATACTPTLAVALLAGVDATCTGNADCAMRRCEEARDRPCMMQQCTGNAAPNCTSVTCMNSCSADGTNFNNDGVCDDGDLANAVSAICTWGSDCGDCGPRRGPAPAPVKKLGEQCIDPYQCGAGYSDFSSAAGWCVPVDETAVIEHCVPDCTTAPHSCPPTFDCQSLRFTDESGMAKPITDDAGNVARACFPTMCGG